MTSILSRPQCVKLELNPERVQDTDINAIISIWTMLSAMQADIHVLKNLGLLSRTEMGETIIRFKGFVISR